MISLTPRVDKNLNNPIKGSTGHLLRLSGAGGVGFEQDEIFSVFQKPAKQN